MPNMSDSRRKGIQKRRLKAENARKRAGKIAKKVRNKAGPGKSGASKAGARKSG